MEMSKAWPLFTVSELEGGSIVAMELGPRSEMNAKRRALDVQRKRNHLSAEEVSGLDAPELDESDAQVAQDSDTEKLKRREEPVTVGAQIGDETAAEAVMPLVMKLRQNIREFCIGPYSSEVDEFALVLRIDGEIWYWEKQGCDRLRHSQKRRYVTIDIYVPRERWEGVSGIEIRRYLAACVEDAFRQMIGKLERDRVPVDGDALLRDFAAVKDRYLDEIAAATAS